MLGRKALVEYALLVTLLVTMAVSHPANANARPVPVTSVSGDPTNDESPKSGPRAAATFKIMQTPRQFSRSFGQGWAYRFALIRALLFLLR